MSKACSTHGKKWNVYRILVEKPEGKNALGRPRCTLEDITKVDLREIGWSVWTGLTWLRIRKNGWLL
jgi:hypothetical protein